MKTKKGEKEKLRGLILEKAISYLKRNGEGAAGTDQIMKYMGLTRGALYSHFESKDDLFAQAVCHDLQNLEDSIAKRVRLHKHAAIKGLIEDHLSEKNLTDVENSCVFTSLSTDMQRSDPHFRGLYQEYIDRIYQLFADALKEHFPEASPIELQAKAINLYSGLVGTLTMARTVKDLDLARATLEMGRAFLIENFVTHSDPNLFATSKT